MEIEISLEARIEIGEKRISIRRKIDVPNLRTLEQFEKSEFEFINRLDYETKHLRAAIYKSIREELREIGKVSIDEIERFFKE